MAGELPDPPYGPEVDLKDFPFTPLYRARLFGSSFHARANDAEWRAGLTLWLKSQDQVPAGSLPTDDIDLCRLAELGRDLKTWLKVKAMALHGWFECADGRLYHPVVAEITNWQWEQRQAQRSRTEAARAARAAKRLSQSLSQTENTSVTDTATDTVTGSKGSKVKEREVKGSEAPPRIPSESEREESVAARDQVQEEQDLNDPVVRHFVPPPQAPNRNTLRENIKTQLRQKVMRYCNAKLQGDDKAKALNGLMGEDPEHDAQWWLDELDRRRKREGWDDTREWKREHLGAAR